MPRTLLPFARFLNALRPPEEVQRLTAAASAAAQQQQQQQPPPQQQQQLQQPQQQQQHQQQQQQQQQQQHSLTAHFQRVAEELYALTRDDSSVPGPNLHAVPDSEGDVQRRVAFWEEREEEALRCAAAGRHFMSKVAPTQVRRFHTLRITVLTLWSFRRVCSCGRFIYEICAVYVLIHTLFFFYAYRFVCTHYI